MPEENKVWKETETNEEMVSLILIVSLMKILKENLRPICSLADRKNKQEKENIWAISTLTNSCFIL